MAKVSMNAQQRSQVLQAAAVITAACMQQGEILSERVETQIAMQAVRLVARIDQVIEILGENPELINGPAKPSLAETVRLMTILLKEENEAVAKAKKDASDEAAKAAFEAQTGK